LHWVGMLGFVGTGAFMWVPTFAVEKGGYRIFALRAEGVGGRMRSCLPGTPAIG